MEAETQSVRFFSRYAFPVIKKRACFFDVRYVIVQAQPKGSGGVDFTQLTPLTPAVIQRQATINFGTFNVFFSSAHPNARANARHVSQKFVLIDALLLLLAVYFVGTIGHVAHGKSTVVRAISGVQTVRFKDEKERNITIRLG